MSNKVLIYGGSGGIGSAIARQLKKSGYDLHLVGRSETALAALASELTATFTRGDVTDPDLFGQVMDDAGKELQGLVYAVGTINLRSLRQLSAADFLKDFQVNASGAALAVQAALSSLRKGTQPTSVVLFSSVAASQGFINHTSMGMAKAAVSGLTLSLAAELAPRVRVNAIAPSLTETPLAAPLTNNPTMAEALAKMHALLRLGTPEDIAALACFLLSQESAWMTGQILGLDGGRSTLRIRS